MAKKNMTIVIEEFGKNQPQIMGEVDIKKKKNPTADVITSSQADRMRRRYKRKTKMK